jgi:pimeloyl-ACP methyl ester carboxylesterase
VSITDRKEKPLMKYEKVDVLFQNESAEIMLSGTLTKPIEKTTFPVAILIHGQGPMDRDHYHSLIGKSPFKTIAHFLAGKGIASLRFDKRGIGKSEGDFSAAGIDDFVSDVEAAYEWLTGQEKVDTDNIGLIGISEGGIVAPLVASKSDRIAFCVMLAGPVLPGIENMTLSLAILANGNLSRDQSFTTYRDQLSALFNLIEGGISTSSAREGALKLAAQLPPYVINDNTRVILGGVEQLTPEEFVGMLSSPCFNAPFIHNPRHYLPRIECPILALYGAKDVHVPAHEHIVEINRILKGSRNKDYTITEIPNANHLFQKCQSGFPAEYQMLDHDVSPEVLEFIGSWVMDRIKGEE